MHDISFYFTPVKTVPNTQEGSIGEHVIVHDDNGFPELKNKSLALFDVLEYRRSQINAETNPLDNFRESFYQLNLGDDWGKQIYDLGTILPGETIEDSYYALSRVVSELVKKDIIPIIIGGGHDLTLACYKGFGALEQTVNICTIDAELDIGEPTEGISCKGFVSQLLMERPCYLFNYSKSFILMWFDWALSMMILKGRNHI